jgi:hydroxycarboxylate dehydrogenase B
LFVEAELRVTLAYKATFWRYPNRRRSVPSQALAPSEAVNFSAALLVGYGAAPIDARVVADHLVEAETSGLPSHGLIRVPQYVDEIVAGAIDPAAIPQIRETSGGRLDIDARRCFGQVAGELAVQHGARLAKERGLALVTVRQSGHAGRIGAYAEHLGRAGFLALIYCSSPRSGHRVAPFGGRDGRLSTNPVAFSIPTSDQPIVGDFSTAASPEGRIRSLRNRGLDAPPDTLLDADGMGTIDPNALYQNPPGAIMPFGGERLGHRGFALGLLVEAMATLLTGDETADGSRAGNNLAFVVLEVDPEFTLRADRMCEYVVSSRPRGEGPVLLPGFIESDRRRQASEVVIDAVTWAAMLEQAQRAGIAVPGTK